MCMDIYEFHTTLPFILNLEHYFQTDINSCHSEKSQIK